MTPTLAIVSLLLVAGGGFAGWAVTSKKAAASGQPAPPLPAIGHGGILAYIASALHQHALEHQLANGLSQHLPGPTSPLPTPVAPQHQQIDLASILGVVQQVIAAAQSISLPPQTPATTAAPPVVPKPA